PGSGEGPAVEVEPRGYRIRPGHAWLDRARRCEALGSPQADVILPGAEILPVGRLLGALPVDGRRSGIDGGLPGFGEELPEYLLGCLVAILTEHLVSQAAVRIEDVEGRPVLVPESPPDPEIVVDSHRPRDADLLHLLTHVVQVVLEDELGRMGADDQKFRAAVALGPGSQIRNGAPPVDAGVGPEIDQHDLAAQRLGADGR